MARRIATVILFLLSFSSAWAQKPFHKHFRISEQGETVGVNGLAKDSLGYLWLATDAGVYKFDGQRFYLIADSIQAEATAIVNVCGNIIAGYKDGHLAVAQEDVMKPLPVYGNAPQAEINDIYCRHEGMLWLATEEGLYAVMENNSVAITTDAGLNDNFCYTVTSYNRAILTGNDHGINSISTTGVKDISTQIQIPDNIVRVIRATERNALWAGMQQKGVLYYYNNERYAKEDWQWGQVNDILPQINGRAWVATEDGYLISIKSTGDSLRCRAYYFGKRLHKLVKDGAGNLWVGTEDGLTMVTAEYASYVELPAPYKLEDVTAIECDRHNVCWYAMNNILYKKDLNGDAAPAEVYNAGATITALHTDHMGRLWIGTFGNGLWYRSATGSFYNVKTTKELDNGGILDITGNGNSLWVASLNGVEELEYPDVYGNIKPIKHHDKRSGIGSDYVYQLYTDLKGNIWMATDGAGVSMYNGRQYTRWDSAEGMTAKVVYTITQDAYGNMWAGTLRGLYKYDGEKWRHFGLAEGLQALNISTVAANASGQVIVVHEKGIDEWYPGSNYFRQFNTRQGVHIDSFSNVLKLSATDEDGNVIVPFEHGLLVFNNIEGVSDIRPAVHITGVSVYFESVSKNKQEFNHNQEHLTFRFNSVNHINPDGVSYRYKLEGLSNEWISTSDESVTFPRLPPGEYTFRVQSSLNRNFTHAREAVYSFTIHNPFWKEAWFIILAALAVACVVYGYMRLRERNLRKLNSLQRERMIFEYEHLKSQVNPHFLFNSFNTLASLIDEDPKVAMHYTEHLSDLYRNMLSYRDKDVIWLKEEWEILMNYMFIQQNRFGDALRLETDVPQELMTSKRIVPLALQLLVENAIKHNVVSQTKPLTITITATEHTITVRNPIQPKISKEKSEGLGLANIRKRYSLLTRESIYFGREDGEYVVKLPLL